MESAQEWRGGRENRRRERGGRIGGEKGREIKGEKMEERNGERKGKREREREKGKERKGKRGREREKGKERKGERKGGMERERERERARERERESERERERERETLWMTLWMTADDAANRHRLALGPRMVAGAAGRQDQRVIRGLAYSSAGALRHCFAQTQGGMRVHTHIHRDDDACTHARTSARTHAHTYTEALLNIETARAEQAEYLTDPG